nr:hypothetical protein [uncultured Lacibacter sp.]
MKQISFLLLFLFGCFNISLFAQVTIEAFPMDPQTGQYNYFGVRASIAEVQSNDVIVTGYIYNDGNGPDTNHPFSVTISAGNLTAETAATFYQTDPAASAAVMLGSITAYYAGVAITFDAANNRLKFNSTTDVFTVINQLNTDYETYNDNYEAQYPNLTAEQLDDMDEQNGFDEFKPYKDFEKLFTGYNSKRAELETLEINWLNNNFSGTDPDDHDFTFDDGENSIFNNGGSFQVGQVVYELTSEGMYVGGILIDDTNGIAALDYKNVGENSLAMINPDQGKKFMKGIKTMNFERLFWNTSYYPTKQLAPNLCKTNKNKVSPPFIPSGSSSRFILKVAINSIGVRNAVKAKVIHYKTGSNGKSKRARANLAVAVSGTTYYSNCAVRDYPSKSKPNNGGFLRKKQLKVVDDEWGGSIWRTKTGELIGSFATSDGYTGSLPLTW